MVTSSSFPKRWFLLTKATSIPLPIIMIQPRCFRGKFGATFFHLQVPVGPRQARKMGCLGRPGKPLAVGREGQSWVLFGGLFFWCPFLLGEWKVMFLFMVWVNDKWCINVGASCGNSFRLATCCVLGSFVRGSTNRDEMAKLFQADMLMPLKACR